MQFYLALGRIVFLYHKMIILFFNETIKSEELLVPEGPPPGTLSPSWVDTAEACLASQTSPFSIIQDCIQHTRVSLFPR